MNLLSLKKRIKIRKPNIGQTGIKDADLIELINQAVDRCNEIGKFYTKTSYFDSEEDIAEYAISEKITDFLGIDKVPIYFKDSNGDYQKVYPRSKAYIAKVFPDYMNADSVDIPQYYYIDGDRLVLYPAPNVTRTNALRVEHLKTSTPMTNDDDFPFTGSTTEITAFRPMDEAIVAFVDWQIEPAYGKVSDTDLGERRFTTEVRKAKRKIKRRPDAIGDPGRRMRL